MAEKEERIAIYVTESQVVEGDYGDFYNTISRTEAIQRMARALYSKYVVRCNSEDCPNDGPTCEGCKIWKKYEEMAAAALDALLEVNRNE